MIILDLFDMFLFLLKKVSYNDFVMTFSYMFFLVLVFKAYRSLVHVA